MSVRCVTVFLFCAVFVEILMVLFFVLGLILPFSKVSVHASGFVKATMLWHICYAYVITSKGGRYVSIALRTNAWYSFSGVM